VAVVVVERHDAGVVNLVRDAEGPATEVTGGGVLPQGLVEVVVVVVLVFEFGDSLRARAVEDEFDLVFGVVGELLRGLESVEDAAVVCVRFVAGQDHDGCFRHCSSH
jgi:hypothetical protein